MYLFSCVKIINIIIILLAEEYSRTLISLKWFWKVHWCKNSFHPISSIIWCSVLFSLSLLVLFPSLLQPQPEADSILTVRHTPTQPELAQNKKNTSVVFNFPWRLVSGKFCFRGCKESYVLLQQL